MKVHRLVAETFIPNLNNKSQVNHKNGIKTDNRIENLEWCDAKENTRHAVNYLGVIKGVRGGDNGKSKLCDNDIVEIRRFLKKGMLTQQRIADNYGVSQATIWCIKEKKTWSHII